MRRDREPKKPIGDGESIHNTVKFSPVTNGNRTLDLVDRPKISVVIIYEDIAAGKRAKHFYNRVIRKLADECDFSLELWNFQVVAISGVATSARKPLQRQTSSFSRCAAKLSFLPRLEIGSKDGLG
jgi:hypothetical protein